MEADVDSAGESEVDLTEVAEWDFDEDDEEEVVGEGEEDLFSGWNCETNSFTQFDSSGDSGRDPSSSSDGNVDEVRYPQGTRRITRSRRS